LDENWQLRQEREQLRDQRDQLKDEVKELKRLIFGSKKERFIPTPDANLEPKKCCSGCNNSIP
jgi:hypothetical protein